MVKIPFLLQSQDKRGVDDIKTSVKVPNAQVKRKSKQIAALFRKGNQDGNKKTKANNSTRFPR
jgi:hypothetical protein